MTHIEQLIQDMCPEGVVFKTLGELGVFENTGVDKKSHDDEQEVTLLNFMDVCRHKYIDASIPSMVVTAPDKKIEQCNVLKNDIFITPSSETIDEIGFAAVIMEDLPNVVYSYHIMRYRLNHPNTTTAKFIRYLFEAPIIRKQILKGAKGLTRFGLSKYQFADLSIPFPPLEIQERIVELLDEFSALAAELQVGLQGEYQMRRKQYEHYRTQLLTPHSDCNSAAKSDDCNWEWKTTNDVKMESFWLMPATPHYTEVGIPYITSKNIKNGDIDFQNCNYITEEDYKSMSANRKAQVGDLLVTMIGTIGEAAFVKTDMLFYGQNIYVVRLDTTKINPKYYYYYLTSPSVKEKLENRKNASSQGYIKSGSIENLLIPLPPLAEQERIVAILDKFEALTTSLSDGIPAEQTAQQKRYEYYRNQLLTFKRRAV